MNVIEAVIFDMDGLMIDTERLHHQSFKATLENRGIVPVPNGQGVIHVSGISAEDNWDRFKRNYGFEADNAELSREKHDIHLQLLDQQVTAMPGLFELLALLRRNHLLTAIASSSIRQQIDLVVARLAIGKFFDAIVSGDDVEHGKPAPDIFLEAAEALQVPPARCVVLEDASSGVRAGRAAGMAVIAVPNPFTRYEGSSILRGKRDTIL